ncbi:hypothetical protein EYF80_051760 [Liparis tanakae]|uniref:Uncharacterized protein n=1 Tax=Liparis tanakae TaxID=230148 RepID=A0A4Z2FCF8_9TELE|nr:hypothetical protein EYF80_051760 [Liparis tanakae]
MIWRGVVGKQGLLRNPELIGKWMQVCSSHTQPARYRDGKHTEWLGDRAAIAQLVARRDHDSRMRSCPHREMDGVSGAALVTEVPSVRAKPKLPAQFMLTEV